MFGSRAPSNDSFVEGTVLTVDSERKICNVRTIKGQGLSNVRWISSSGGVGRGGDSSTPQLNDRVIVFTGLGYPLIIGYLLGLENGVSYPSSLSGSTIVRPGNATPMASASAAPSAPKDVVSGDKVLSTEGGNFFALLRSGSVVLRASRLAQIFLSKIDDVIKVVARNLEIFTDGTTEVSATVGSDTFRVEGFTKTAAAGRADSYELLRYYGNVAMAESLKWDYAAATSGPSFGGILYKQTVGGSNMVETYNLNGETIRIVGGKTTIKQNGTEILLQNDNGTCKVHLTPSLVTVNFNDVSTVTCNGSQVQAVHGTSKCTLDDSSAKLESSGHYIQVSGGGINMA